LPHALARDFSKRYIPMPSWSKGHADS
jgi:hypothetical protein